MHYNKSSFQVYLLFDKICHFSQIAFSQRLKLFLDSQQTSPKLNNTINH